MAAATKWLNRLREYHNQVLPVEIADWPERWREEYEERAGIIEFEAYQPRWKAEQAAKKIVQNTYLRHHKNHENLLGSPHKVQGGRNDSYLQG